MGYMAQATPYDIPQNFSTTLNVGGGIDDNQTTGIVLTSVTGLPTDGGVLCFDWSTSLDTAVAEYIEYTGISGNTLTGVTRGVEGVSAKAHSNGAVVAGIISRMHIKRVRDKQTGNDEVALQDPNANEILKTGYVASAVNEVTLTNAATGGNPKIEATGGDTNVGFDLQLKGTGVVNVKGTATASAEVRLFEDTDNGTNYFGLKAPSALTASTTLTLPDGVGSSGQALTTDGTDTLTWSSPTVIPKRARVYKDSAQSITNNTETLLTFNQETFDNDTMHDNSTNNSRITITTAGVYLLKAQVAFASNATGYRQALFKKNNSSALAYVTIAAANGERTNVQITTLAELSASDYIEVYGRQTSGGALNVEGAASDPYYATHFEAIRLGASS